MNEAVHSQSRRVIPIRSVPAGPSRRQQWRSVTQVGFFVLFALAPVFDLFRYDLVAGHAWLLTFPWRLGIDASLASHTGGTAAGIGILTRLFLPIVAIIAAGVYVAWRWGRLYCGWLCPHFSAVETINLMMRRASGKHSLWDRQPTPPTAANGSLIPRSRWWWLPTLALSFGFAATWSVVLLTYLLPPAEVYGNLLHLDFTRSQAIFLSAATTVLMLEFLFARHLFCRFGCAIGLFQSLAWMSNRGAMVVGFRRERAGDCAACHAKDGPGHAACEAACPMRLKPRTPKVRMFTCTQCAQCIEACTTVQGKQGRSGLLRWVGDEEARRNEAQVSLTGRAD